MWEINYSIIPLVMLIFVEAYHDWHHDFVVRYLRTIYCKKCAKAMRTISYSFKKARIGKIIKLFMFGLAFLAVVLGVNLASIAIYAGVRLLIFDFLCHILQYKKFSFKRLWQSTEYYYWYQILTKKRAI